MTKKISCPDCNGHGVLSECTEYGIYGKICERCNGTCAIEIPMNTADYIRQMSYEELASLLLDFYMSGMDDVSVSLNLEKKTAEIVSWLKRTDIY